MSLRLIIVISLEVISLWLCLQSRTKQCGMVFSWDQIFILFCEEGHFTSSPGCSPCLFHCVTHNGMLTIAHFQLPKLLNVLAVTWAWTWNLISFLPVEWPLLCSVFSASLTYIHTHTPKEHRGALHYAFSQAKKLIALRGRKWDGAEIFCTFLLLLWRFAIQM